MRGFAVRALARHLERGHRRLRRAVVLAPQFHENHILTESLAFNLLMGKRWPAYGVEIEEAIEVCRQLGLGELERVVLGVGVDLRRGLARRQAEHGQQGKDAIHVGRENQADDSNHDSTPRRETRYACRPWKKAWKSKKM